MFSQLDKRSQKEKSSFKVSIFFSYCLFSFYLYTLWCMPVIKVYLKCILMLHCPRNAVFQENSSPWPLSHQLPASEQAAFCRNSISHKTCEANEMQIIVCFNCYNVIRTSIWNWSAENRYFSKVILIALFLNFDRRYHNDEKYQDSCFNPVSLFHLTYT